MVSLHHSLHYIMVYITSQFPLHRSLNYITV